MIAVKKRMSNEYFEEEREVEILPREEKDSRGKKWWDRYAYGENRSWGIRTGNIIIRRVKKSKDREKEGDKGKRWNRGSGRNGEGRGFILRCDWNPKCSEGTLSSCVVPRQCHSRIPRYGMGLYESVWMRACTSLNKQAHVREMDLCIFHERDVKKYL